MAIYKSDIVDVNLESGSIHRSFLSHTIGSGDDDANRFGMRTFRDGVAEDLSGASCQAVFINAEGTKIALTSYGTVNGNEAYVTLPQACYNVEGQFCLAIKLVKNGVTVTSRIVDGVVLNTGTTGSVAPTESVPTYQEILSTYDDMVAATAAANTAIAEEFDATKAYPEGKYVINNGNMYLLPEGHTANTTWANTVKVQCNIGDETTSYKTAILPAFTNVLTPSETKSGYYTITTTATFVPNSNWKSYLYDAADFQIAYVKAYSYGTGTYQYCIIDSSSNVLDKGEAGDTTAAYWEKLIPMPANASKLIVITKAGTDEEALTTDPAFVNNGAYTSGSLNDAIRGGTYSIENDVISSEAVTDLPPTSEGGTVLNLPGFGYNKDNILQIYIDVNNSIFARFLIVNGSTSTEFKPWRPLTPQRIILTPDTKDYYGDNASDFPYNTEILIDSNWYEDTEDLPRALYIIKTIAGSIQASSTDNSPPKLQLAYSVSNGAGSAFTAYNVVANRTILQGNVSGWRLAKQTGEFKRYVAFGDSVCRGNHPDASKSDYAWPEAFGRVNNFIVNNKAIGGQGYVNRQYVQTTALETIQASSFTGIDLATLAYGINDAQNSSVTIGTINDTTTDTVMGSLYQCINRIYSQNPKIQVVVIGTTPQNGTWSERLAEINEKEKLLCEKYRIPFVDMHDCPINGFNGLTGGSLTSDGTHFNDDGYQLLSQFIVAKLSAVVTNAY